jgi:hypothetical protein
MRRKELFNGGFVPYEQYNPPFITEDMNVTMLMLERHIMPDGADIDALADALAEALKHGMVPNVSEPKKNPTTP